MKEFFKKLYNTVKIPVLIITMGLLCHYLIVSSNNSDLFNKSIIITYDELKQMIENRDI